MRTSLWLCVRFWWWVTGRKPGPVCDAATVGDLLDLQYTSEELLAFGKPPPARPGIVTHFDPGLSVAELRKIAGGRISLRGWNLAADHAFWQKTEPPCYRQVEMVSDRHCGGIDAEQRARLPRSAEGCTIRAMVTAVVICRLATGVDLLGCDSIVRWDDSPR